MCQRQPQNVPAQRNVDVTVNISVRIWDNEALQQWKPFNVGIAPKLQQARVSCIVSSK